MTIKERIEAMQSRVGGCFADCVQDNFGEVEKMVAEAVLAEREACSKEGVSLRDYFAAKAMQALVPITFVQPTANNAQVNFDEFKKSFRFAASVAYLYASAMLEHRDPETNHEHQQRQTLPR